MIGLILPVLGMAACSDGQERVSTSESYVGRQSLYAQLDQLEQSLGYDYPADPLPAPDVTPREWVRTARLESDADRENARVKRLIAFQELARLPAPVADAPDFNAFWELHAAYRFAVETGRTGHASSDLIYSRPFPIDHVSGPHLAVQDLLDYLQSDRNDWSSEELADYLPRLAASLNAAHRRLELSATSGVLPPEAIISRLHDDVSASPLRDQTSFLAWRTVWRATGREETPRPPAKVSLAQTMADLLVPEVEALLNTLTEIQARGTPGVPEPSYVPEQFNALLAQLTSGRMDGQSCLVTASRLADETVTEFWGVVQNDWDRHIPMPETIVTEDGETFTPEREIDGIPVPELPQEAITIWSQRAPVFPLPPEPETSELSAASTPPVSETPPLPESFIRFEQALVRLSADIDAFSKEPTALLQMSPVLPPAPEGRSASGPPGQSSAMSHLFERMDQTRDNDVVRLNISVDHLERLPMSQNILAVLKNFIPGHDFRVRQVSTSEDTPRLARGVSTLAFDLGWPLFALDTLASRGAFNQAPQLEAAMLYDRLMTFAQAEAEAGLLSGLWTEDDAVRSLSSRLGMSEAVARDLLLLFRAEPGFACAAVEGYTTYSTLIDRAEGVLGPRFVLADFHEELLSDGSRPLTIVERDMDSWIAASVN
mgnify:FL=1